MNWAQCAMVTAVYSVPAGYFACLAKQGWHEAPPGERHEMNKNALAWHCGFVGLAWPIVFAYAYAVRALRPASKGGA